MEQLHFQGLARGNWVKQVLGVGVAAGVLAQTVRVPGKQQKPFLHGGNDGVMASGQGCVNFSETGLVGLVGDVDRHVTGFVGQIQVRKVVCTAGG